MNKKAFIGGWMVDFYAYIAFVLIIIIFFMLFTLGDDQIKSSITGDSSDMVAEMNLISLLRTELHIDLNAEVPGLPVAFRKMPISEYIALWYSDKPKHGSIFRSDMVNALKNLPQEPGKKWGLSIRKLGSSGTDFIIIAYSGGISESSAAAFVPVDENTILEVRLFQDFPDYGLYGMGA